MDFMTFMRLLAYVKENTGSLFWHMEEQRVIIQVPISYELMQDIEGAQKMMEPVK